LEVEVELKYSSRFTGLRSPVVGVLLGFWFVVLFVLFELELELELELLQ
jgi:hypothetical protein